MSSSDSEGTETDQDGYDTLEVTADGDTKTTHLNLEESSNGDSEDKEGGGSEKEGGSSKKNSARSDKGGGDLEGSAMLESDELSASDRSEKSKARRTKRTSELIADSPRTGDDEDTLTDPGSEMSEIGDKLPPGTEGVKKKVVRALIKTGKNLREIPGKKKIVAPYIIATMEGQKETMKCKVGNTLLPAWNSKLMFILGTEPTSENLLKFQVFDAKGQTKDELLGETTIEIMKLDWKKKRFEFKDHKLTHPKNDSVQGKLHFIILLSERSFAVETPPSNPKEEKKKLDAQKKQEEKMKKQEEKKKKEAEKGSLRRLKASENSNNGKGTLGKNSKPITEKHTIETKAGVAAPPDLLWNFISNFHDVEEWLPKMPCDILEAEEDGKLRRKIKYPDHEEGVIEKLEEKDDPTMTLKWSSTCKEGDKGLAGTVGYLVTLIIAPVGRTRSRLTWQVEYELPPTADDSEAKKFFEKLVEIGMDGLKVAAEG